MKRSAGILVYKIEDGFIKVLMCHCGGPYYQNKLDTGWSLSKGEYDRKESALAAAKRELKEETNLSVESSIKYLASKRISKSKIVTMFYTNCDFDLKNCKSNYFEKEYPKNSGIIKKFPEMDKYEWMEISEAKKVIFPSQIFFLNKLIEKISKNNYLL